MKNKLLFVLITTTIATIANNTPQIVKLATREIIISMAEQSDLQDLVELEAVEQLDYYEQIVKRYAEYSVAHWPELTEQELQQNRIDSEHVYQSMLDGTHKYNSKIVVARDKESNRLLGSLQIKQWPDDTKQIEYEYLRTFPDVRNQGIGTALMNYGEKVFPDTEGILLHTYRRDQHAISYYQKRGFQIMHPPRWGRYWHTGWHDVPRMVLMVQLYKKLSAS